MAHRTHQIPPMSQKKKRPNRVAGRRPPGPHTTGHCGSASGGSWQSRRIEQHSFSLPRWLAARLHRSASTPACVQLWSYCLPSSALPEEQADDKRLRREYLNGHNLVVGTLPGYIITLSDTNAGGQPCPVLSRLLDSAPVAEREPDSRFQLSCGGLACGSGIGRRRAAS